jgi:hypothetical protein
LYTYGANKLLCVNSALTFSIADVFCAERRRSEFWPSSASPIDQHSM